VRQTDVTAALQDFAGRTVAYNSTDSQSGYNSLRALIAPLAIQGRFFGAHVETGGHLRSIDSVREGQADMAAIDCVTLAGVTRYQPERLQGLAIWGETAAYPGLPLVTSATTPAREVSHLRESLAQISSEAAYRNICEPLLIEGFEVLSATDYAPCLTLRDQALAVGVETL
jgi:ABC-type phosphate/phosphonate transport system substrate-binding protein